MDALFGERKPGERFLTSQITTLEARSAPARNLAGRPRAIASFATRFVEDLLQIEVVFLSTDLIAEAGQVAASNKLRALDAIHWRLLSSRAGRSRHPWS